MANSKQEIISELKNKLNEFKSKIKKSSNNNIENSPKEGEDIINMEISMNTLKNFYKSQKDKNIDAVNSKENIQQIINNNDDNNNDKILDDNIYKKQFDNIKYNNYIKDSSILNDNIANNNNKKEKLKPNISSINNITNKNYLDFDLDEIIKKSKKKKSNLLNEKPEAKHCLKTLKSKTFVNFDELNINQSRKESNLLNYTKNISIIPNKEKFIKLNTNKNLSNTDRNHRFINVFNPTDYEENFSEPNIYNNINNNNNNNSNAFKIQNKLSDFMNEIQLGNNNNYNYIKKNNYKKGFSLNKPKINNDRFKYDIDNLLYSDNKDNFYNEKTNDKTDYFNIKDLFKYDKINDDKTKTRYSSNRKNSSYHNMPKFNINYNNNNNSSFSTNNLMLQNNNKKTLVKFNYYNSNINYLNTFDNNNNNNCANYNNYVNNNNSLCNEIHHINSIIRNLTTQEINNLPLSTYKEIKELYNLLYIKFFNDN
jgi:hypothetical protein